MRRDGIVPNTKVFGTILSLLIQFATSADADTISNLTVLLTVHKPNSPLIAMLRTTRRVKIAPMLPNFCNDGETQESLK